MSVWQEIRRANRHTRIARGRLQNGAGCGQSSQCFWPCFWARHAAALTCPRGRPHTRPSDSQTSRQRTGCSTSGPATRSRVRILWDNLRGSSSKRMDAVSASVPRAGVPHEWRALARLKFTDATYSSGRGRTRRYTYSCPSRPHAARSSCRPCRTFRSPWRCRCPTSWSRRTWSS